MAKTLDQVTDEIIDLIVSNFSPRLIDTRVGTVLRDTIISPFATQVKDIFDTIDQVAKDQSIIAPDDISETAMNGLAENFGLSRYAGSPASGIVRFTKVVLPTSTISVPAGTHVATGSTNDIDSIVFRTLSTVQLTPFSPADPISGAQAYVDVGVTAELSGSVGNVDAGTITMVLDPVPGVDVIFNPSAMTGGKETQTNTELADLIKARSQGRLGTKSGYKDLVLSNFSVDDVEVIGHDDPEATRDQFGGEVDVVVLSSNSNEAIETFAFVNIITTTQLLPTFKPVISVNSIEGVDAFATPITLIGPAGGVGVGGVGSDYDVVLDTTGPYAGSYLENTKIVMHPTTNIPADGSTLTMSYQNNDLVRVIQSFLDLDENKVIGADPLSKSGVKVNSAVEADIRVIPGYSTGTVSTNVQTAIEDTFNALQLGDDIQASDVITSIGNVEGVDFVDTGAFILALATAPATPLQEITAKKHEFIRVTSVTVNLI